MVMKQLIFRLTLPSLCLICSGCYVNRAVVDPFSYVPKSPTHYWKTDRRAKELKCIQNTAGECPELPSDDKILSLAAVLDLALINNTKTRTSWAQARQAAAIYGQSQSYNLPNIEGVFNYQNIRSSFLSSQVDPFGNITGQNELITATFSEWGPQLQLSYLIFDFGEKRAESEAARFALYFADYTHNRTIQTLIQTITLDYYQFLYQKKLMMAYEADLATAQQSLDEALLSIQKGVKDVSDVLLAKTQFLQTELKLIAQRQTLNTSFATLLTDMGLPSNCSFKVQDFPKITPDDQFLLSLDDYLQLAFECRPDYLAAKADLRSKEENLSAARRQRLPTLNYTLNFGRTYWTGGLNDDYDYTSTLSLSMPFFTGFYITNNIKLASERKRESESTLRHVELGIIKEVTTSHFNIKVAYDTLNAARTLLIAAEEQYRVAIHKYAQGVNTILDVSSAQSALADARATEAAALQEWFNALATLSYSIGIVSKKPESTP